MIRSLKGKLIQKSTKKASFDQIVLEVNGIGYLLWITNADQLELESEYFFWVYHLFKQDDQELVAFRTLEELDCFKVLIKVRNIGTKAALAILGSFSPVDFAKIIENEDIKKISSISGIGLKTAQILLIQLKKDLKAFAQREDPTPQPGSDMIKLDVLSALKSLGYSDSESKECLKLISDFSNIENALKQALFLLAK